MKPSREADERLAVRCKRLEAETLAEARAAVARGRRFHCLDWLRAPWIFFRTLIVERSFLEGTSSLIRAGLNAMHAFVTPLHVWAIQRGVERVDEPHKKLPIIMKDGPCTIMIRSTWRERLAGWDLYHTAVEAPRAPQFAGRADLGLIEVDGARLLCKQMRHGGWMAKVMGTRYLDSRKPRNELLVAGRALACRVPTAEVVAVILKRGPWPWYQYWLISAELAETVDLLAYLQTRRPRAERLPVLAAIGRAVRAMHEAGILHADLHLKNILVRLTNPEQPEAFIIDFDKARALPRLGMRERFGNIARLWRSAEKARSVGMPIGLTDMMAFLRAYAGDAFPRYLELVRGYRRIEHHRQRYARRAASRASR